MVLLNNIWHLPMLWWLVVPTAAVVLFDIVLVWESRIPEKKDPTKITGIAHPKSRLQH